MLKNVSSTVLIKKHLPMVKKHLCWNVTTEQIILKDKGDIDALCATDRSRK